MVSRMRFSVQSALLANEVAFQAKNLRNRFIVRTLALYSQHFIFFVIYNLENKVTYWVYL
jgi:hypothetical protein